MKQLFLLIVIINVIFDYNNFKHLISLLLLLAGSSVYLKTPKKPEKQRKGQKTRKKIRDFKQNFEIPEKTPKIPDFYFAVTKIIIHLYVMRTLYKTNIFSRKNLHFLSTKTQEKKTNF